MFAQRFLHEPIPFTAWHRVTEHWDMGVSRGQQSQL